MSYTLSLVLIDQRINCCHVPETLLIGIFQVLGSQNDLGEDFTIDIVTRSECYTSGRQLTVRADGNRLLVL